VASNPAPSPARTARRAVRRERPAGRRERPAGLAASDTRLRAVFDSTPVPMLLLDGQRRILAANQTFAELFGYTPA
jgi:PAS domain-containing protein